MKTRFLLVILFTLIFLSDFSNKVNGQSFPMVISNTPMPSCSPVPLGVRCNQNAHSFNSQITTTPAPAPMRFVAKSVVQGIPAIAGFGLSDPSPSNGVSVSWYYEIDIPGTPTTVTPPVGYVAAGNTFTNPECGAPYITISPFYDLNIRPSIGDLVNHVYVGGIPSNYALAMHTQNYAVVGSGYDSYGTIWYKINLPDQSSGGFTPCLPANNCSSQYGYVNGSSSYVTLNYSGSNILSPTSVSASSITTSSAIISWVETYFPYNTTFTIKDVYTGTTLGSVSNSLCTSITPLSSFVSLLNCTNYEVEVTASYTSPIGNTCISNPSLPVYFSTGTIPSPVSVSGGGTYCSGPVSIFASGGGGGTIYYQGTTSGGTSTFSPTTFASVSSSGTYYFRALSPTGCWGPEGIVTVTILPPIGSVFLSSGSSPFCASATITASGGSGGTIYFQGTTTGGTSTASPGGSQTVYSSGTYYFRAMNSGCWGPESSIPITIDPIPSAVSVTGGGSFCSGATITASPVSGATVYFQGMTSGGTSTGSSSLSQYVTTSGTYYFRARSPAGCWGSDGSVTVTIISPPFPISGFSSVCAGSTISLTDPTLGGTWSSSSPAVASVDGSGNVSGLIGGFTTISYSNGWCPAATLPITVNPLPAAISGSTQVCLGNTTTLTDTSPGGTWSSSNPGLGSINSTSGVVTGLAAGLLTITYTLPTGCLITMPFTVNSLPLAISGTNNICIGNTTTLFDPSAPGTWSSSNPSVASIGSATGIVTGVAAGTVSITFTQAGTGCTATMPYTVNPNPAAIGGTFMVCVGQTSLLTDATTGGTWSSGNTAIDTVNSTSGLVGGIAAGVTGITYTLSTGCATNIMVTVNPTPLPIIGSSTVCVGSTISLSDAVTGGIWSSSNPLVASIGTGTGLVTGISAGTATITYTLGLGCNVTLPVTVNPVPVAITGTLNVCVGQNTTLSDATTGGAWSSSNTPVATVGPATGLVTGIAAGTAIISYILPTGCFVTAVATVNPIPSIISGNTEVCVGATTTLTNLVPGGTWSSSNTLIASVSTTGDVTGVGAGSVIITYNLGAGCYTTYSMTVDPLPAAIGGPGNVCVGSSITLTDTSPSGTWSSSNAGIATVDPSGGLVSGIAYGTCDITYTLATGCISHTTITVNPLPNFISGTTSVCVGSVVTLSDATAGGSWSSSASLAAVGSSTGIVTGITAGNTFITYTLPTGCYAFVSFTVNPLPLPVSGADSLCIGSSVTFSNATPGGNWSSSNSAVASVSTSGLITGVAHGSATITYLLATGCFAVKTASVDTIPSAGLITGSYSVCAGLHDTLMESVSGGSWGIINTFASVSPGGVLTAISAGTDTVIYTVANSCGTAADSFVFTINPTPLAGSISGPAIVCTGASITLSDTVSGGVWAISNPSLASVAGGLVSGIAAGTDTCTYSVTNMCGTAVAAKILAVDTFPVVGTITGPVNVCNGAGILLSDPTPGGTWGSVNTTASVLAGAVTGVSPGIDTIFYFVTNTCGSDSAFHTVTINPIPSAGIITGPNSVCIGDSITLTDAAPSGIWSSYNVNATVSGGTVTGAAAGYDTIKYSVSIAGCSSFVIHPITVNPNPFAGTITGAGSVCQTQSVTLSDPVSGGVWSSTNADANVTSAGIVTGITPGIDTIKYAVTNMCNTAYALHTVTVNPLPHAAPVSGNAIVCVWGTLNLTDSVTGGIWSSDNSSAKVLNGVVTGQKTGTDSIRYSVTNICGTSTVAKFITIDSLPVVAPITGQSAMCTGSSVILSDATAGGAWSVSNNNGSILAGVVSGIKSGIDTIRYTVTNYCGTSVVNHTVTIDPAPDAGVIKGPADLCLNGSVLLKDSIAGGIWSATNTNASVEMGWVHGDAIGSDSILYSVVNGCGPDTARHLVIVHAFPPSPVIKQNYNVLYVDSIYATYQWSILNTVIPGATNSHYTMEKPGVYDIAATSIYGCIVYSSITITDIGCEWSKITVFPNPTDQIVHIDWCTGVTYTLHTIDGRLIDTQKDANSVDLSGLANGVYMLTLYDDSTNRKTPVKLVKISKK